MPLTVPGAELAVIRHYRPISNIDLTYGELGAYVIKHEISIQGPVRETYVRGFLDTEDASAWETDLMADLPLRLSLTRAASNMNRPRRAFSAFLNAL